MMTRDISTSKDIKTLVDAFYNDVKQDSIIGYVFNDVAHVDWHEHLPKMYKLYPRHLNRVERSAVARGIGTDLN